MIERCPHCSFDPTGLNDYCAEHRPAPPSREAEIAARLKDTDAEYADPSNAVTNGNVTVYQTTWSELYENDESNRDLSADLRSLLAQLQQAREALEKYGEHLRSCACSARGVRGQQIPICTCGLDAALKGTNGAL